MPRSLACLWFRLAVHAALAALVLAPPLVHAQSGKDKAASFYEDALRRYERKDIPGAIIQLKNALQIDKDQLAVQVLLGRALLANSDPIGASVSFKEALRLGVDRAEVVVPLAAALIAIGRHNEVVEQQLFQPAGLPRVLQQDLLLLIAEAWTDLGQGPRAQRAIDDARALGADRPSVHLAEVAQRIRSRQYSDAMELVRQALRLAPDSLDALRLQGLLFQLQGKSAEALQSYSLALKSDARHVPALQARAGLYIDLGRMQDAKTDLDALAAIQPKDPSAAFLRALVAERTAAPQAAKAALAEVTALIDPVPLDYIRYRPDTLMLNGLAHFGLGEYGKAKPYLEAALKAQGQSPAAKLLARVYLEERTPEKAVDLLESYLRTAPGDPQALTLLASIHIAQGRGARASNLLRDAMRVNDAPAFHLALGMSQLKAHRPADALASFESAYKRDPRQLYAGVALASMYLRERQGKKAVAIAETLVKQAPTNAALQVLRGQAHAQLGDFRHARLAFETALTLDPSYREAALGLTRVDIAERKFEAAVQRLDRLLSADPESAELMLEMARAADAQERVSDMQRWLTKAEDVSPQSDATAMLASVHFNLARGLVDKALEAARRAQVKRPDDPAIALLLGRIQLRSGDRNGARTSLAAASKRAAMDTSLLMDIAELQLQAQDAIGARYAIEKVLSERPGTPRAVAIAVGVDLQEGDIAQAEKRADQLIKSLPHSALGYHLKADVALAKKQAKAALAALQRAHQLQPTTASLLRLFSVQQAIEGLPAASPVAQAWLKRAPNDRLVIRALGDAHARAGQFEAARRYYDRAIVIDSSDAESLNSLANVAIRSNDKQAVALAQRALKLQPGNAMYIDTLGWAMHMAGNSEAALPILRDARLRLPTNAEIRLHLGSVLAKLGRHAEARAELDIAAAGTDNNVTTEARKLLHTLK